MRRETRKGSLKEGAIVMAALAFGWLAIELAFKPWLHKARAAIDNSDPAHDPDDVVDSPPSDDDAAADRR